MTCAAYREAFVSGLTPDPDFTVSEWADAHRYLSQKAAAEPGRWRTDRTPYLRDIMDDLSPRSPVQRVVFMKGAQVGGTEAGNNWLGYVVDMSPGPIMLVQPTVDIAKRLSKQRIAPMIEETPRLKDKIADSRSRDSGNTMMVKEFPGGVMIITGANSAAGLRSMPIRFAFLDEVDAYPADVDGEGDPVSLAERRTTTFARRKVLLVSTPTIKDASRIEREYLASDQRRFFIPCPHCGEMQWLKWAQLKWDDGDPNTAHYVCEVNGCVIEEHTKTDFLSQGEWRETATGDGRTHGYHLSSLYSPLGWKSWAEIASEFLMAKNDPPLLKTFVNTILGETWEDEYAAKIGAGDLRDRVEFYPIGMAPAGVLALVLGVDVQDNRFALTLKGYGRDEECWVLDHQEIYGDPARPEVWRQLADVIKRPVRHELFEPMPILSTCIDSGGHFTHEVYAFAREHKALGVLAIKGQSQRNKPVIARPTKVDLNIRQQVLKSGAEVWPVGSDTAKSTIYARLKLNEAGAGFIHFPHGLPEDYFEQLTAEKLVTRYVKGFPVREWQKRSGARNEALDTFVYGFAALNALYMRFNRRTIWEQLEARWTPLRKGPEAPVNLPVKPRSGSIPGRSSFVTDW